MNGSLPMSEIIIITKLTRADNPFKTELITVTVYFVLVVSVDIVLPLSDFFQSK